jgi:hypothetical protein
MNGYLRQATASQSRLIGPFIDDVDFKTAKTALTIANTDIKLRANGTTLANKNSGGGTHQVNGMYSVTFDATDTANVGELYFSVVVATALQVFGNYVVLEEAVYDALFAASAAGFGTAQTGDAFARLGAPAGASVSADIAALPTATANADAVLKRDWNSVTGEAARSLLNAARFLRNKWSITGSTLTVTKEDDTTAAWTSALVGTPGADPVTSSDPA